MRVKLDENLPVELADDLRRLGHDVDSVVSEGLANQPDLVVARAARRAQRVLFTLDKGLGDIRLFPPRLYGGLVVFRLSKTGRMSVRLGVLNALPRIIAHGRFTGRLLIVTESSVRARR